jgi:serine-type D-Ala-D-Ala carboxypeptidase (penicillin-binding protein 5/6)
MKKRLGFLLLILLLLFSSVPVYGQGFDTAAGVAALMEASTGQFLYLKNADEQRPPASITKVMTLLLAFEALERGDIEWDETTIVSRAAWSKEVEGSKMFLGLGQEVSVRDLIYGISIVSANDGCVALAEHLYGSEAAFVQQMNKRAQELGMTGTTFKNSTGLPAEGHVMTARDIAVVSRELVVNHPRILEIEAMRDFTFNDIWQQNRNPLLGAYPGADGLKTGWTTESLFSLVGAAQQDGRRLISVVLNTESENARLVASRELLDHGFRNFRAVTVVSAGTEVGEVPVKDGRRPQVAVAVAEDVSVAVPAGRENEIETALEADALTAPVEAGSPAGNLLVRLDGETIYSAPVVAAEDMARANIFVRGFRGLISFFRSLINRR